MGRMTDAELLGGWARERDARAFDELAGRHADMVHGVAARVLGPGGGADDVCQAVFIVLMKEARKLTRHPDLAGWLHLTAVNLARHAIRAGARRRRREEEAMHEREFTSKPPRADLRGELDAALAALPARFREAVVLVHLEGASYAQAAERLGVPEGTVASRVNAGAEKLRRKLGGAGCFVALGFLVDWLKGEAAHAAPLHVKAGLSAMAASGGAVVGAGAASLNAVRIAEGAMRTVLWTKVRLAGAGLAIGGLAAVSLALAGGPGEKNTDGGKKPVVAEPAAKKETGKPRAAKNGPRILWQVGIRTADANTKLPKRLSKAAREAISLTEKRGAQLRLTACRDRVLVRSAHVLSARDALTGKQFWAYREKGKVDNVRVKGMPLGGRPAAITDPLVSGGHLYVGTSGGAVRKLSLADGSELQSVTLPAEKVVLPHPDLKLPPDWTGKGDAPKSIIEYMKKNAENTVAALKAGRPSFTVRPFLHAGVLYLISSKERAYALDAKTFRQVWKARTGPMLQGSEPRLTLSPDGRLYFGTSSRKLYEISADAGRISGEFDLPGGNVSPVVVDEDRVYAWTTDLAMDLRAMLRKTTRARIIRAAKANGEDPAAKLKEEEAEMLELGMAAMEVQMKRMGLTVNTQPGAKTAPYLCAYDRKTRGKLWSLRLGEDAMAAGELLRDGDVLYCMSSSHLFAVSTKGRELWKYDLGEAWEDTRSLVMDGDVLYAASDAALHAVNSKSGAPLWKLELGGRKPVAPAKALKGKYARARDVVGLGKPKLKDLPPNGFISGLAVRHGVVYVATTAGSVYAVLPPKAEAPKALKKPPEQF